MIDVVEPILIACAKNCDGFLIPAEPCPACGSMKFEIREELHGVDGEGVEARSEYDLETKRVGSSIVTEAVVVGVEIYCQKCDAHLTPKNSD